MTSGAILVLMGVLFLGFGYMGVPVSFALMAGVFVATAFTQVSLQSMVGQLFHGIDSETLLAVPFFLLVGELMASSDVVHRMIRLSQTLVGHLRGGLAQVVTLFSMFFAGISGSSVADVAVLTRTVAPEMDKEGYDRPFTAALIACASTMANLIPPSIMAVVYGATGNVSIGGLFLAGVVPGVLIGIGLMVYSYFWGPVGVMKRRASFTEVAVAARGAALPLISGRLRGDAWVRPPPLRRRPSILSGASSIWRLSMSATSWANDRKSTSACASVESSSIVMLSSLQYFPRVSDNHLMALKELTLRISSN